MKKNILIIGLTVLCAALAFSVKQAAQAQESEKQIIEYLEFREVDIKDVLRQLAKQYNLNIVFSEAVKGMVTVQLNNVTVLQALDSIATVNGFVYSKKENVYKITTQAEAGSEGTQTRVFKLNNADATVLKTSLTKVLSSSGSVEADSRSNSLIVTDSLGVINKIEGMISGLDEVTPQVFIEAKLIETSLTKSEKLGIDWSTTVTASGAARKITAPFSPNPTENEAAWMKNIIPLSSASNTDFPSSSANAFPYTVKSDFTFGTLDFTSLKMVFDMLKDRSDTKLVANPRIVTMNNLKATINVGKTLSLPTYERNDTTGNMEITGWQTMNVGVNLEVTPQVSPNGYIKIKLKPEVSSLLGYASTRNGVNEGPITSTRTAETEVQIKDSQTVVIGGLVKDETLIHSKKIPILGDIPVLGWMFKRYEVGSSDNPTEKTDLLIFVTARIIKDTNFPNTMTGNALATEKKLKLNLRAIKLSRVE